MVLLVIPASLLVKTVHRHYRAHRVLWGISFRDQIVLPVHLLALIVPRTLSALPVFPSFTYQALIACNAHSPVKDCVSDL